MARRLAFLAAAAIVGMMLANWPLSGAVRGAGPAVASDQPLGSSNPTTTRPATAKASGAATAPETRPDNQLGSGQVETRLLVILGEVLGKQKSELAAVTRSSTWDDLDADDLDQVEIVMECEDAFGIEIPDESADKFKTLGDLIDFIKKAKAVPANPDKPPSGAPGASRK